MSKSSRRMKFAVEALEDRQLLSVTTTLINGGSTLVITGGNLSEHVKVAQDDQANLLSVSSYLVNDPTERSITRVQTFESSSISRIVINLGGGDDELVYQLDGSGVSWAKSLSVDLGIGNDQAHFDLGGKLIVALNQPVAIPSVDDSGNLVIPDPTYWPLPVPADLSANVAIDVNGGVGNDTIDAIFGNINKNLTFRASGGVGDDTLNAQVAGGVSAASVVLLDLDGGAGADQLWVDLGNQSIAAGGKVTVNERGGAGNDVMSFNARLALFGALNLNQSGGAGDDTTTAYALMTWPSTGSVTARINGETGNDKMTLGIQREAIPPNVALFAPLKTMRVDVMLNGGAGRNQAWVTPNVRTFFTTVMQRSWDVGQVFPID